MLLCYNGSNWCIMMKKNTKLVKRKQRLSISLSADDYEKVTSLAKNHKPPFSLRYVIEYAIIRLLEESTEPGFYSRLGDPRERTS